MRKKYIKRMTMLAGVLLTVPLVAFTACGDNTESSSESVAQVESNNSSSSSGASWRTFEYKEPEVNEKVNPLSEEDEAADLSRFWDLAVPPPYSGAPSWPVTVAGQQRIRIPIEEHALFNQAHSTALWAGDGAGAYEGTIGGILCANLGQTRGLSFVLYDEYTEETIIEASSPLESVFLSQVSETGLLEVTMFVWDSEVDWDLDGYCTVWVEDLYSRNFIIMFSDYREPDDLKEGKDFLDTIIVGELLG